MNSRRVSAILFLLFTCCALPTVVARADDAGTDAQFHPFHFAVLSDLHLAEKQGPERLDRALQMVAGRKDIAFVLVVGDIIWPKDPELLKPILAKAGVPVHLVYNPENAPK